MVGYFAALFVDQLTGVGLLDQQNSFFGKVLLHVCVFGILLVRCARGPGGQGGKPGNEGGCAGRPRARARCASPPAASPAPDSAPPYPPSKTNHPRTRTDLDKYKNLLDEATFYDSQWNAAWEGVQRPSETERSA
jgi:hypothetical protein